MIDDTENFDQSIYILDRETNTTFDITLSDFEIALGEGIYEGRFYLVFQPSNPVSIDQYHNDFVSIHYANEELTIVKKHKMEVKSVQILNSIGQIIFESNAQSILSNQEIHIPFNFAKATYVVRVIGEKANASFKFINHLN
jgi:hypothetical protein